MHIIATDDEQSALNVLMGAISEAVPLATVHGFRNPLEALELMKETKCEIAFLDIQMREMSGIVLARKLKEIYPKVSNTYEAFFPLIATAVIYFLLTWMLSLLLGLVKRRFEPKRRRTEDILKGVKTV